MLNALHYDWQLNRSHRIYLEKLVFSADIKVIHACTVWIRRMQDLILQTEMFASATERRPFLAVLAEAFGRERKVKSILQSKIEYWQ